MSELTPQLPRPKSTVLALAIGSETARAGIQAIRALRRHVPSVVLRYAPEAAQAMLAEVLREPQSPRSGSGSWVASSDVLFVPELHPSVWSQIWSALANGIPVICWSSSEAAALLGRAGFLVPEADGWKGVSDTIDRLIGERDREPIIRRCRAQARIVKHLWDRTHAEIRTPRRRPTPGLTADGPAALAVEEVPGTTDSRSESTAVKPRPQALRTVSVVLALHGLRFMTEQCLRSLRADFASSGVDWELEIICVDNASPDDTREWLRTMEGVHVVEFPENRGCPRAWNAGLRRARGEVLCVLNNDTFIHPGGLVKLVSAAWEIGISAFSGGVLDGELSHVRMTDDANDSDYPDGCALAFRRDVYLTVGGFDEGMGLGYCEDSDWGLRARERGYRWAITPGILTHYGSQTARRMPELAALQARNQAKLRERWRNKGAGEQLHVLRWGAIGDVVMLTPVLAELRRRKPFARIHLQCAPPVAELLKGLPCVDSVSSDPPAPSGRKISFHNLNDVYERHLEAGEWRHPTLAFAAALDMPVRAEPYLVPDPPELADWAASALPKRGFPPPTYIACGIRSGCRPKANWGEASWRALVDAVPDCTFVLFDADENPSLEVVGEYLGQRLWDAPNIVNLTGKTTSMRHVSAALRRCSGAVAVDSGVFHLATAAGLPVVALMGGTPTWARAPLVGKVHMIQGSAPCYPCRQVEQCTRKDGPHCLESASPLQVAEILRGMLSSSPGSTIGAG